MSHLRALQKDNALLRSLLVSPASAGDGPTNKVDLEKVVDRMRTLTRENEEFEARLMELSERGEDEKEGAAEEELRQSMQGTFSILHSFARTYASACLRADTFIGLFV